MGIDISKDVSDEADFLETANKCFSRDGEWTEYHAEQLADLVARSQQFTRSFDHIAAERKAFGYWQDGRYEKAISIIDKALLNEADLDKQSNGWLKQLIARISDDWGNTKLAESTQQDAYSLNRGLMRPKVRPPYKAMLFPHEQSKAIVSQLDDFRIRRGFLRKFEDTVSYLHAGATTNQFEQALQELGTLIGFSAERKDDQGVGPDVLWLFPNKRAWIIEAKSGKQGRNSLTKGDHGQLLVAAQWFTNAYPGVQPVKVSVLPQGVATKAAAAIDCKALTFQKLILLVAEARRVLTLLCESQLPPMELVNYCSDLLADSSIAAERIDTFLIAFQSE
jgi:tetratricopeptide (TPR) repeat protein